MNPRLAAGAGVLSAFLLLGGTGAAVAVAHPGHSHGSDRGHSSDRGGNSGRGSHHGKPGADRRDFNSGRDFNNGRGDSRGRDNDNNSRGSGSPKPGDAPSSRVGSGRSESPPPASNRSAIASSPAPAARSTASVPNTNAAGRSTPEREPVVSSGSVPAVGDGGADSTSGSDRPSAPASAGEAPPVRFGNGRTPVYGGDAPPSRWQPSAPAPVAEPAPPPPPSAPAPVPAPSLGDRVATSSAIARQFVGAPASEPGGALWGIAGLLLIPAAGAALGYRQARAAQAADRLRRV